MRQIKFRGKDIETGEWLYGSLVLRAGRFSNIMFSYEHLGKLLYSERCVKPDTIGQYTGLRDKDGVRIYEGDILKFPDCETALVEFNQNQCSFDCGIELLGFVPANRASVIGNIHDNPELLQEERQ